MELTMFENFNARRISLTEAKRILNRSGNAYSDEEVKRVLDYLHAVAELVAEYAGRQNESVQWIPNGDNPLSHEQLHEVTGRRRLKIERI